MDDISRQIGERVSAFLIRSVVLVTLHHTYSDFFVCRFWEFASGTKGSWEIPGGFGAFGLMISLGLGLGACR